MVKSFLKNKFPKLFKTEVKPVKQEFHPPKFAVEVIHTIVPAFISGGVQYNRFEDIMNLGHARAWRAREVYEEIDARITKEHILLYSDAVNNLLTAEKINIFEIKKLNDALRERAEFVVSGDTLWKWAAVTFFDESENPYDYDYKHGIEKIKLWRKEQDLSAFFFNTPMKELVPFLNMSEEDLRIYIQVAEQITKKQLDDIYQYTSRNKRNQDLFKISELLNTASH